jgi:hypothetical protein
VSHLPLTQEEEDAYYSRLVLQRLTSREDLKNWILGFLDVDLADCKVSRYATSTPLDMTWEIYEFCANQTNDDPMTIMFIAGRGSQKTLSCAVLQILLPLHFGRGVVHLGGTEDQANRAYSYFKKFVNRKYIKNFLKDDPKISKTSFVVNSKEVDIEILPLTIASVNGPHQPVVSIDELASLAPNKLEAYPSIAGIPVYTHDGKPWIQFGISSRKGRYTIIETEYEERHKTGTIFKFWTTLENTQRCPDEISGTEPLEMYVNPFEAKALLQQEFDELDPLKKDAFEKVNAKKGCYSCPLASQCGGDLKNQISTCRSLQPTRATIKNFKKSPLDWWLSQRMSLQPSAEDLIYPKFSRKDFEKTPREIYKIFTGIDPGVDLTKADIIRELVKSGVKRYAGVDHGYTHPFAIVIVFEDSVGNVFVMKAYEETNLEPGDLVDLVAKLKVEFQFTTIYPDTAAPAINKMLKKVSVVKDDFKKDVDAGIQLIRHKMNPSVGPTKFYGLKGEVTPLVNNLEKYHFQLDGGGKLTDKPVKEFDDSHDALSYIAQNRWNSSKAIINPTETIQESEIGKDNKEKPGIYKAKVEKQYDNWMQKEIGSAITEQGASPGMSQSKNKSHFWDIE